MGNKIGEFAKQRRKEEADERLGAEMLEALGDIDLGESGWVFVSHSRKIVEVLPGWQRSARDVAIECLTAVRRARPTLDPVTEGAKKTFNSETGKITFTLPAPVEGWMIAVTGGDPRCKVKQVTVEEEVPEEPAKEAVPAHTVTRTKYVLADPEACGAAGGGE